MRWCFVVFQAFVLALHVLKRDSEGAGIAERSNAFANLYSAKPGSHRVRQSEPNLGGVRVGNDAQVLCDDIKILIVRVNEIYGNRFAHAKAEIRDENQDARVSIGTKVEPGRDALFGKWIAQKQERVEGCRLIRVGAA